MLRTTPTFTGPSWADVSALQGAIQASYGGFCVIHATAVPHYAGRYRECWFAKWAPSLPHAHLCWLRGASGFYPDPEYPTVPTLLMHLLRQLDKGLGVDEERRRVLRLPRLADIVLPPLANWSENVT